MYGRRITTIPFHYAADEEAIICFRSCEFLLQEAQLYSKSVLEELALYNKL
jgi:hypothetical protein